MIIAHRPISLVADSATGKARFGDCMWDQFPKSNILCNCSFKTVSSLTMSVTEDTVSAEEIMTWLQAFKKVHCPSLEADEL